MSVKVCPLLLLLGCCACGSMIPVSSTKNRTVLVQSVTSTEATITLQYLRSQANLFIFDMEVSNHSTRPIYIAPQTIGFYASQKLFPSVESGKDISKLSTEHSTLQRKKQFAHSPLQVKSIYRDRAKSKAAGAVFFAVIGTGIAIYDGIKDEEDYQKERWTKKDEKKEFIRDVAVTAATTAADIATDIAYKAADDSYYLPFELFPECKIDSGKTVRGKIFIPIETRLRYSRVIVPVKNTDFVFDFKRPSAKPR